MAVCSASLIAATREGLPPIVLVFRSMSLSWLQRKGWQLGSNSVKHAAAFAATVETPIAWPLLLRPPTKPTAPPKVPRSSILPFSQRNGSRGGTPVTGLGVVLV